MFKAFQSVHVGLINIFFHDRPYNYTVQFWDCWKLEAILVRYVYNDVDGLGSLQFKVSATVIDLDWKR